MVLSGWRRELVGKILAGLAQQEKAKALNFVDNWDLLKLAGIGERAETGEPLKEPWGATMDFPSFRDLVLLPTHIDPLPLMEDEEVDLSVTIGPYAGQPLVVKIPVFVAGMGYGVSLAKKAKIGLAQGATMAGTAISSGEGGFVAEEREAAAKYIVQYTRGRFGNAPEILAQADMLEVKVGQGASATTGFVASGLDPDFKTHLKLGQEEKNAYMPARFPDITDMQSLKSLVEELKELANGVPVGLKMAAGRLEEELNTGLAAGFDVFIIDGAEGGTYKSLEVTINNFGLPTLYAIPRAHRFLLAAGRRQAVSLIAAGGMRTAGDFLKAIALGADAVYIGSAALVALTYSQWHRLPLGSMPGDLFFYGGKHVGLLDLNQASQGLANYLAASAAEMKAGLRTMGKKSIKELGSSDLVALQPLTAEITGVEPAYRPQRSGRELTKV